MMRFARDCKTYSSFFLKILYVLLLGRGEGREREVEKHWSVASCTPLTRDLACNPVLCSDQVEQSNRWPFGLCVGLHQTHWATPVWEKPSPLEVATSLTSHMIAMAAVSCHSYAGKGGGWIPLLCADSFNGERNQCVQSHPRLHSEPQTNTSCMWVNLYWWYPLCCAW